MLLLVAADKPFHPRQVPNRIVFWVHPETVSAKEGAEVKQWNDDSSGKHHFKVNGHGPIMCHNQVNSYPALRFDGVTIANSFTKANLTVILVASVDGKKWHIITQIRAGSVGHVLSVPKGYIAEALAYEGPVSKVNIDKLVNYLANKYAI